VEIVILLQGTNLKNEQIYSYIEITGRSLKELFRKMQANENFKPVDYGIVLASGTGEPTEEVRAKMKNEFNMIEVPMPETRRVDQPEFTGYSTSNESDVSAGSSLTNQQLAAMQSSMEFELACRALETAGVTFFKPKS
jgi:hypothetical protein